ncbi:TetR/AcrR family transcriptional regulator [Enorma massiliensis]|uniref:HTH tetR-type domain-containing protein n=1 Tax=Enorma massiliensis TaxID=1472761 RepID=A0A1Y3U5T0_9ACTN|nr:TetR/AcrR family transcriptional regulator [Enorma massiliensis]OUN42568.1 hypothetical protein B5G21_06980 [Enorma massiliensis]
MARNKYPEETVRRILDVAEELFYTKGYEHTTMADIVDGLGGLTKGAVYHHFKSKEEIFEAVFERANRPVYERSDAILADRSLTGLEKFRALDKASSEGPSVDMWHAMRPSSDPVQNPRLIAQEFVDAMDTAHRYVEPVIREGMADGSIAAEHPREVAEVLILLANLWLVPMFNPLPADDREAYQRRVQTFLRVSHAVGVDLVGWKSLDQKRVGKVAEEEGWASWRWAQREPWAGGVEEPAAGMVVGKEPVAGATAGEGSAAAAASEEGAATGTAASPAAVGEGNAAAAASEEGHAAGTAASPAGAGEEPDGCPRETDS